MTEIADPIFKYDPDDEDNLYKNIRSTALNLYINDCELLQVTHSR